MESRTFICLFDLKAYDDLVAPTLRQYTRSFDPDGVVSLLEKMDQIHPEGDLKHWIDSIRPDKGYKPSEQTVRELCEIVIPGLCLPQEPGLTPKQDADILLPWLGQVSDWFADLMDDGEELAGARLEFGFGNGRLVATREQIAQFSEELAGLAPPEAPWDKVAPDFANLKRMVARASAEKNWTLLKTAVEQAEPVPQHPD